MTKEGFYMFTVSISRKMLVCEMSEAPKGHKFLKPVEMACRIEMDLGTAPSKPAAKTLRDGMDKAFNALVKARSAGFLKQLNSDIAALGAVIEKDGMDSARASKFLQDEEKNIKALWENWSQRVAPKMADQVLVEVVKKAREPELKDLQKQKIKTVGRVTAVPVLAIASAVASAVTGNVAGVASAALKGASASMKMKEDLSKALNDYDTELGAAKRDLAAVADALKGVAKRIKAMEAHRASSEMAVAQLAAEQRGLKRALKLVEDSGGKEAAGLQKQLDANAARVQALVKTWPDSAAMRAALTRMAEDHKAMVQALGTVATGSAKSLRDARDLTDGGKEILSVLSKLT
ncbi:hypothetical protein N6L27_09020 [Leisingera sp. SS27]|uniref:hypothetical protein n=1 Tax=Leisingera sp. SS27 TaxID=2979462 RepID=UPI00232B1516|nr:hypothetical protein [Leisingera sp. SS27]MDC0658133.1 hypothetical protein [Leisingera sp. SS27]